jgi:hypothetical protein
LLDARLGDSALLAIFGSNEDGTPVLPNQRPGDAPTILQDDDHQGFLGGLWGFQYACKEHKANEK